MSLTPAATQALEAFTHANSWEARARLLMQWGERLAPLTEAERTADNQVQGCDSKVWLVAEFNAPHWHFRAASEARLIRGLLAVLLARVEGLNAEQLLALDLADWFNQLGLARQLSPSRSNGLNAVLHKMRSISGASL